MRNRSPLPPYALVDRTQGLGMHPFMRLLPRVAESPALARLAPHPAGRDKLLATARVRISAMPGYAYIDVETPCIVLAWSYYQFGNARDLYLDLLHELTHLRQLDEGADLWDRRFAYVDRITEIEGYAVAVEEGRRLGMSDAAVVQHLSNPWMTRKDVSRLLEHVESFLAAHPRE